MSIASSSSIAIVVEIKLRTEIVKESLALFNYEETTVYTLTEQQKGITYLYASLDKHPYVRTVVIFTQ